MTEDKVKAIKARRKKLYKKMLIFIIPLLVLFLVLGFFAYINISQMINNVSENGLPTSYGDVIEKYGYYLRKDATNYQKELFKELQKACNDENATDEEIVSLVCKNYIADMYTWTNKAGTYDVGGICYVYTNHRSSISMFARDTFYKYLSKYIKEYGSENLLEVESVEVESVEYSGETYTYHDDDHQQVGNLWGVVCKWHYVDKNEFNDNNYSTWTYMTVSKRDDGRFEILESYGDE